LVGARNVAVTAWAAAVAAAVAIAVGASRPAAHTKTTEVTWTADVGPIVASRCAGCHRPDGFGSPSLVSYADAKPWASAIRDEVLSGRMPPWPAVEGFASFSNDARLSAVETELLVRWAEGGAPLGPDVARIPETPRLDVSHSTLRLELPAVDVDGASTERISVTIGGDDEQWITGWELRPGTASLLQQAEVTIEPDAPLGTWTPLDPRIEFPAGTAQRLPAGSRVVVALRYRKSVEPRRDRSSLVLRLGSRPRHELRHRSFECGSHRIERDVQVVAINPRAEAAGDSIEVVAYGRDGRVEPLSVVSRYLPAYPVTYRLRAPIRLERGARLDVRSSSNRCDAMVDYFVP
jgi:mono/diheme cytochrome c family protein